MGTTESLRSELARLKGVEASLRKELSRHESDRAKADEEAHKREAAARRTTSESLARSCRNAAERARRNAGTAGGKAADVSKKLATNAHAQASKERSLAAALKADQQVTDREAQQRRRVEREHARELSRLAAIPATVVQVPAPKPEQLRVLYLTASPEGDLRTDTEVRQVQQTLRGAKHRDAVDIQIRPAATFQDLLDGLNDIRPHIVHFAGHGGGENLAFDSGAIDAREYRAVDYQLLLDAFSATDEPPLLLVLNACDTLDGAEAFLATVPAVIAMAADVPDVAAIVFAGQFYSALASGQSVGTALKQGRVSIKAAMPGDAHHLPQVAVRADVALDRLILVRA